MHPPPLSRRGFLRGGGCLVVAFAPAPWSVGFLGPDGGKTVAADQVDGFLAIGPDNGVTIYSGKVDLGTGARAALRQIVAEELGMLTDHIALVEGDTALTPNQGPTSGSQGIVTGGRQIRQAAATARQALLRLAAARLNRPESELETVRGKVCVKGGGAPGIPFAVLIDGRSFDLPVDPKAPLADPATYRIVGTSLPRPDLPGKLTGQHVYVHDVRVPDMLHGRVIRPPAIGASLVAVDESSVAGLPGPVHIVRIKDFLGVVAPTEWGAIRAAARLKAEWTVPAKLPGSDGLYAHMRATPVARTEVLRRRGDPAAALDGAKDVLAATYEWPAQSHASLGPSCAVADVRDGGATVWTSSQATHRARDTFARFLGLDPARVRMVYRDGAGCYGMNGADDAAADAALLSRAVGRPVRVQWSRADELGWDPKGPPQILDLRAVLDGKGGIAAWETRALVPENTPGHAAIPLLGPVAAGLMPAAGQSVGMVQQNTDPPYAIPHMQAVIRWLETTPLRPSNLRAPGKIGNTLAVEGFIDELAAAAGADPLEFRLRLLTEKRGIAVLQRLAARMRWSPRTGPRQIDRQAGLLQGRGIAYVHYKHSENFVALGVEAEVAPATGRIRVTRAVCAYDGGMLVNPDAVRAQVEGCILQTISRTLFEEVTFDHARVTSTDWASYPILAFPDVPVLEIDLVNTKQEPPLGAGEAAAAPVAAAVANAVADAAGIRLRTAPFTPDRVKAAFAAG